MRLPRLLAVLGVVSEGVWGAKNNKKEDNIKSVQLQTHTIQEPYLDSEMGNRWWEFGGDTVIRTDKYIRLTPDRASREGWLFSKIPLTATNFEVELEFKIGGEGSLYGDGMAMWITKERAQPGKVFGHADKFNGLGIFFDTYKNNRPGVTFPYVMAMLGDGNTAYDKGNDGKDNEVAGCSARGLRNAQIVTKARLTYFQDQNMVLSLQYKDEDEWTECFDKSNITLPSPVYLGFSAETGELHDNHDVVSVTTKNLYDNDAREKTRKEHKEHLDNRRAQREGRTWGWFFTKVFLFFLMCGGGYAGFTFYRARQRSRF